MKVFTPLRTALEKVGVQTKLLSAFGALLVMTALVGGVALFSLHSVNAEAGTLARKWLTGVVQLAEARSAVINAREFELKHSRTDDTSYHAEYEDKLTETVKGLDARMAVYKTLVASDAESKLVADFDKAWADYLKFQTQVVKLGRGKQQQDAADIADGASSMAFDETLGGLNVLLAFNQAGGQAAAEHAEEVYGRSRTFTAALMAAGVLLGLILAWAITRSLLHQLGGDPRSAVAVAKAVAEGDLTTVIAVKPGDHDSLMAWLQTMQRSLGRAVTQVRQGSDQVATASAQIAQGNQDLSSRTEEQASALQQTAATMDELGSTVRNNADNAREASQLAQNASKVAVQGGAVVGEVVQTMKGINDSSRKIADIIGTIDGIAFQTNILALNSQWWPARCAAWRNARPRPPSRSRV